MSPGSILERRLAELGFLSYEEYLRSSHWVETRLHWQIAEMPEQCLVCRRRDYNLHHRSYTLLGEEPLGHLAALCEDHHYEVHRLLKRRVSGVNLWNAHLVYRKHYNERRGGQLRRFDSIELDFLGRGVPAPACELVEPDPAVLAESQTAPRAELV